MVGSPAFRTRHDHNIAGTKEDGDRFHIASYPAKQEYRGAPNTVAVSGWHDEGGGGGSLRHGDERGGSANL